MESRLSDNNNKKKLADSFRDRLIGLPRPLKQLVALVTDAGGFTLSAIGVAWLLFGTDLTIEQISRFCLITVAIALPLAWFQGLYQSVVRYIGLDLLVAGATTAAGTGLASGAIFYFLGVSNAPFRWAVAFWGMAFIYICCSRYLARVFLVHRGPGDERERIIIYGAGSAGAQLATGFDLADRWLQL